MIRLITIPAIFILSNLFCQSSVRELVNVKDIIPNIEIDLKYEGYIARQQAEVERNRSQHGAPIPANLNYEEIRGLSNEVRQKLQQVRPETIGQASRISGVTPAAVSLLLIHLKKRQLSSRKTA